MAAMTNNNSRTAHEVLLHVLDHVRPAHLHDHIGSVMQRRGVGLPDRRAGKRHGLKGGERRIRWRMKLALDDVLDHVARNSRRCVLQLRQLGPVVRCE